MSVSTHTVTCPTLVESTTLAFGRLGSWSIFPHLLFKICFHTVRTTALYCMASRSTSISSLCLYSWRYLSLSSSVWHHPSQPEASCFFSKTCQCIPDSPCLENTTLRESLPPCTPSPRPGPIPDSPTSHWNTINWDNQTNSLSKLFQRPVKRRCWRFER